MSDWFHVRFDGRPVTFALITSHTRDHAVFPRSQSAAGTWVQMIDREVFTIDFDAAILACVSITNAEISTRKRYRCSWLTVVGCEEDYLGDAEDSAHGAHTLILRRLA